MAVKKTKKKNNLNLYRDDDFGTTYVRHPRTGKFLGRRPVKKGKSDRTAVWRVKSGLQEGQIMGRTKSIPVKGSKNKRGTVRTVKKKKKKKK